MVNDSVVVRECGERDTGLVEELGGQWEAVGENGDDGNDLTSESPYGIDSLEGRMAGGDKVFEDDDRRAGLKLSLDEVFKAMVLRGVADVDKREGKEVGDECTLGNSARSDSGDGVGLWVVLGDESSELELEEGAYRRIREGLAVVAVNGGLPTGGPGERDGGLELDCFDLQELASDDLIKVIHKSIIMCAQR